MFELFRNGSGVGPGSMGEGGGVYNGQNSTLVSSDNQIYNNAASTEGGGVFNQGTFTDYGSTIGMYNGTNGWTPWGNGAAVGGGFAQDSNAEATSEFYDNSVIAWNSATKSGGGIYQGAGLVTLNTGCEIEENAATNATGVGGGITVFHGTANLTGTNLSFNTAGTDTGAGRGGGAYVYGGGQLIITNSDIGFNTAAGGGKGGGMGGGVYNLGSLTLSNDGVGNNNAGYQGGGLYIADPEYSTTLNQGTTFMGNQAAGGNKDNGNGIYDQNGMAISGVAGTTFFDNDDPNKEPVQGP
jgi:hypothetical protein